MSELPKIDFLYLNEQDMIKAGVMDMAGCVDTMEDMFKLLHSGDYRMAGANNDSHGAMIMFPEDSPFETMPKPTADRRFMAMPAYLGGQYCTAGVKWYGSNIANRDKGLPRSILMFTLNDADTSAPLAYMSANLLSAYRTGAVPGVGARHLARKDSKVVGVQGPGVMGKTSLAAFMATCPKLDTLKLLGRSQASIDGFVAWTKENYPQITTIEIVDDLETLVRGSDIITYCASCETGDVSKYPIVKREWLKAGAFLSMPAACEIDDAMEDDSVRKVMDNIGLYDAWFEELPKPAHVYVPVIGVRFLDMIHEGKMTRDALEDLGDICAGAAPGRQNNEEIIILSVGGMPVEDVAWATVLYRNALEKGIGTKLNLWDEPVLR
ncbi:ornithine cyclodeaminase [Cohaesibacter sp. ES.047]|uniref:tyramine oxidase subunit B n=1 Tax=Cohaesibacter sp. ES.047 TaxID=1798205 RepID=UPI000BB71BCF|nr:tyramine oxidase subunit B [Cohaesibacter sp. ES.047]SNY89918.1 ornithine cyclodeaminase [Cohaesibacter sp. ES.047]